MNWSSNWSTPKPSIDDVSMRKIDQYNVGQDQVIQPSDIDQGPKHWDALSQDELLMMHLALKQKLEAAKDAEMELRKYIVNRAFPAKQEGMNTLELGGGYQLKASIKFNYKLADNNTVEKTLDAIAAIGNEGTFIAERLVSWTPNFLLTEYRKIQEEAQTSQSAKAILEMINKMLIITDAAPGLEIKEPKAKKK